MLHADRRDRAVLLNPLFHAGRGFYLLIGVLLLIIAWGFVIYIRQLVLGLGVTGMNRPIFWGMYMVNFIFFIGISHAGTLISAILRVSQAEWRRPITRIAEAITVFALIVGSLQILFDLGGPDRLHFIFRYGRLQSPLLWDALSVTAYFLGSLVYLYLPLIPDTALQRDNLPAGAPRWRHRLYSVLALGWRGNRTQWIRLEKTIAVTAVLIIPVAVSVHTIISWILATNSQPGWQSTIFGPYFVVGAIYSGIAALFIAMAIMRRAMHLEAYITERQFRNLGLIFIAMSAIWFYFTFAEYLTEMASQSTGEFPVLVAKLWGQHEGSFWNMILLMLIGFWIMVFPLLTPRSMGSSFLFHRPLRIILAVIAGIALVLMFIPTARQWMLSLVGGEIMPFVILAVLLLAGISNLPWLKRHLVESMVIASVCVVVAMWLERWNIIVPTMAYPRLIPSTVYTPTLTEWSLLAASMALFILLFALFFKLFPPVSVWEVAEGRVIDAARSQVEIPMPEQYAEGASS